MILDLTPQQAMVEWADVTALALGHVEEDPVEATGFAMGTARGYEAESGIASAAFVLFEFVC